MLIKTCAHHKWYLMRASAVDHCFNSRSPHLSPVTCYRTSHMSLQPCRSNRTGSFNLTWTHLDLGRLCMADVLISLTPHLGRDTTNLHACPFFRWRLTQKRLCFILNFNHIWTPLLRSRNEKGEQTRKSGSKAVDRKPNEIRRREEAGTETLNHNQKETHTHETYKLNTYID